jgi:AAA15 family ATPase/GTPase
MVHYLKISNFGPIQDEVEMNFEISEQIEEDAYEILMPDGKRLLKLAYIYGPNASGKTTILKAFDFLRKLLLKPIRDKSQELDFDPFLFRDSPFEQSSTLELSFYLEGLRYVYKIRFNKQSVLEENVIFYETAKPTSLFSRDTDLEKRLAVIDFGSKIKVPIRERDLLESNTLHNNTVFGAYAKTNVDIPELEKLNKWFSSYLLGMVSSANDLTEITASQVENNPSINIWLNKFLHKADQQLTKVNVPEWTNQIGIPLEDMFLDLKDRLNDNTKIEYLPINITGSNKYYGGPSARNIDFIHTTKGGKSYSLSILKESNGTKRYFGLGGLLYALIHDSHMLCIDELETSLHPDLMKHFLQTFLLNASQSQLLITTHNISLLEEKDFIRRDALWFIEKNENGIAKFYAASDFDSSILRKDASIIKAYKSGRLGAKPNLGSPFIN